MRRSCCRDFQEGRNGGEVKRGLRGERGEEKGNMEIRLPGQDVVFERVVELLVERGVILALFGVVFFPFAGKRCVDGVHGNCFKFLEGGRSLV
jgi:hypothetical protein